MRTPKQLSKQKAKYQYYAGFANEFVADILEKYATPGARVLDPWNGSGTTTSVCAVQGYQSVGIDINPATIPVAWSRLANSELTKDLCGRVIHATAAQLFAHTDEGCKDELMAAYFDPATCELLRGLRNWLTIT